MGMAIPNDKKLFFETTGNILSGCYVHVETNGKVSFLGDRDDLEEVEYISAEAAKTLLEDAGIDFSALKPGQGVICVKEQDTLDTALEIDAARATATADSKPVLCLNFAAGFEAGGGVQISAHSQEAELCRRSTLYASLTAEEGRGYFDANNSTGSFYTDGLLLSPHVEVYRTSAYYTMPKPKLVAVVSMSAPFARGLKGITADEHEAAMKQRIQGMLDLAIVKGYRDLVLGAWGCGTNGNDPVMMARAFHAALDEPIVDAPRVAYFDSVTFAITDSAKGQPNLTAFRAEFDA